MGRLWSSGAELQVTGAGIEYTAIVTTAPAIETSIKRSGNAAYRINNSGAIEGFRQQFTTGTQGEYFCQLYLYVVAAPAAVRIIFGFGLNGSYKGCIRINTNLTLELYNAEDNAQIGSTSSALSLNTWYRIAMRHDSTTLASTAVEVRAYVDTPGASTFWNTSGTINIVATPTNFRIATTAGDATLDFIVDDIALNDTSGSSQNSWPPDDEHMFAQRPNAAGDNSAWTRGGSDTGANWSQVSGVPPSSSQYVESNTSGQIDDYNLDATPAEMDTGDTVNVVHVGCYAAVSDATGGDPDVVLRIKDSSGGTVEESASLDCNSTVFQGPAPLPANSNYQLTTYARPGGAGVWTKALLDTAQIGIRESVTDTHFVRVGAMWTMVSYTPSAGRTTKNTDPQTLGIAAGVSRRITNPPIG